MPEREVSETGGQRTALYGQPEYLSVLSVKAVVEGHSDGDAAGRPPVASGDRACFCGRTLSVSDG